MKTVSTVSLLVLSLTAASFAAPPKSQNLSSYSDKNGQHPATATAKGPGVISCVNAGDISAQQQHNPELPQYQSACAITGPGFTGLLTSGQSAPISGPGIVVLTCKGPGKFVTCEASIKYQ
jgi:hypothetical protein